MATINFYKDLPLDFTPHPVTGDVRPITNEVAVRRSLSNLINTTKGSRPFMPDYGSSVKNYLFSRNGAFTLYELCLLYTSPSPRDRQKSRMPSSA